MFLEKHSRWFKKFEIAFRPRHKDAPRLPLWADPDTAYSIFDAVKNKIDADEALEVQSNGDIVELMAVEYDARKKALVILVHRASPNAADPSYRRKAREDLGKKIVLRHTEKEEGEDQSVSAHLVIHDALFAGSGYAAALEEIPGINMACIRRIMASLLMEYTYSFKRNKKDIETSVSFTPQGVKSESLTNALKNGHLGHVTLSRPAKTKVVDAKDGFQPETEVLRLKIVGEIDHKNWKQKLGDLVNKSKADGWEDFKVDVNLDDERKRTVKFDREDDASEILFVRSEFATMKSELRSCSDEIVPEVVDSALKIAKTA